MPLIERDQPRVQTGSEGSSAVQNPSLDLPKSVDSPNVAEKHAKAFVADETRRAIQAKVADDGPDVVFDHFRTAGSGLFPAVQQLAQYLGVDVQQAAALALISFITDGMPQDFAPYEGHNHQPLYHIMATGKPYPEQPRYFSYNQPLQAFYPQAQ